MNRQSDIDIDGIPTYRCLEFDSVKQKSEQLKKPNQTKQNKTKQKTPLTDARRQVLPAKGTRVPFSSSASSYSIRCMTLHCEMNV